MRKRPNNSATSVWSMAGDPCPVCGRFDTRVVKSEGLTVHSLKPGSRHRRDSVLVSPYTVLVCRACGNREEQRGFPDGESLRARARVARRSSGPRPPRRLG